MNNNTNIPISAYMIALNEEKLIECAIKSIKNVMGITDIVVADTGSTDATKSIAESCGARVFSFEWRDDFAAARNFAAGKAENDWVIFIDADERAVKADVEKTRRILKNDACAGVITMVELSDDGVRHDALRLYNRKTHHLTGSIHERVTPLDGVSSQLVQVPITLEHSGYLPEMWQEKGKFERNVEMLEKELQKDPDNPYYLYHLGKTYFNHDRDLEKACHYFEKALSKCGDGDMSRTYIYITAECYGYALINTGKYNEALEFLDEYLPRFKDNPNFRFLAAHILQNNGMFQEAVEMYESCIGAEPAGTYDGKGVTSYLPCFNIGVILECVGMVEDAIELYKNCGDYEPAKARLADLGS